MKNYNEERIKFVLLNYKIGLKKYKIKQKNMQIN